MKTIVLKSSLIFMLAAFTLVSCTEDKETNYSGPTTLNDEVIAVPFFTVNEEDEMPSTPADLLYDIRAKQPILSPDGRHLTWAEFSTVRGRAHVQCQENGVEYTLNLTGLIPNGVYTIWDVVFDAPGMDPTDPMLGVDGLGAAGKGDGSDNYFTASADGRASITIYSPAGALSMLSNTDLEACPLTQNFEWHIVGAYHMDGNTYGPVLGPDGTVVEQFGFIFKNDSN